jgi:CRISPR-associated endonuclease/helicase Cas3
VHRHAARAEQHRYFDANKNLRGLENVREIIDDPDALFEALKRVQVELPPDWTTPTPWADIAAQLSAEDCVLAIVNTRKAARELQRLMPEGTLHLSALMCGAHRKDVIARIKERLQAKREGGMGAAARRQHAIGGGRGGHRLPRRLPRPGRARLHRPGRRPLQPRRAPAQQGARGGVRAAGAAAPGHLRKGAEACISTLHGQAHDPLARALFERYFTAFYHSVDLDSQGIVDKLKVEPRTLAVQFRSATAAFRMVEDEANVTVVVRYAEAKDDVDMLLGYLETKGPDRWLMRKLQRYTVSIREELPSRCLGKELENNCGAWLVRAGRGRWAL